MGLVYNIVPVSYGQKGRILQLNYKNRGRVWVEQMVPREERRLFLREKSESGTKICKMLTLGLFIAAEKEKLQCPVEGKVSVRYDQLLLSQLTLCS